MGYKIHGKGREKLLLVVLQSLSHVATGAFEDLKNLMVEIEDFTPRCFRTLTRAVIEGFDGHVSQNDATDGGF